MSTQGSKSEITPKQFVSINFATTTVGTAAWVQLDDSLNFNSCAFTINNSSNNWLMLGLGATGTEAQIATIPPSGYDIQRNIESAQSQRLCVKSVWNNCSTGVFTIDIEGR